MRKYFLIISLFFATVSLGAELPLHCPEDTVKISSVLQMLNEAGDMPIGDKAMIAARQLLGAGQDDYYATDSVASLRINVGSFTPLMFVNNVIALAKASEYPGLKDWHTFADEFESIACRRGENKGFPSIMYHSSDWIGDNMARGNITELTEDYSGMIARTKSLDEMTRKRSDFAALADSATFEAVRMTEMGFRTHRIPTLKKETIKKKDLQSDLRNGDIILLVPNRDGIDLYDIGFVELIEGVPHYIHLSPLTKTIVEESEPLERYMQLMTKYFQGYRILRIRD